MQESKNHNLQNAYSHLNWFIALQSAIFLVWSFLIPSDPKNAFLLGYSVSRWIINSILILIIILILINSIRAKRSYATLKRLFTQPKLETAFNLATLFAGFLLWSTIWLPRDRFPILAEELVRIRPLLLVIELIIFEYLLFFQYSQIKENIDRIVLKLRQLRKPIFWIFLTLFFFLLIFLCLRLFAPRNWAELLIFPPGPPISTFQALLAFLLIGISFLTVKGGSSGKRNKVLFDILLFVLIWGFTFALWSLTPLICNADRIGPFPPNDVCYPEVDDSLYSIGSHYIRLGGGVFNHWFTEKPFYMLFLAFCQMIGGPQIDGYLLVQIAVCSLIPAFLFLFGRRLTYRMGGIVLAYFSTILGVNSILIYSSVGGRNVKIENTEILTSMLLMLVAFALFKYLIDGKNNKWLVITGGLLGISVLTRLNPLFVFPIIVFSILFVNWRHKKKTWAGLGLFLLAFFIIVVPGVLSSRDESGNYYYLQKIQSVLDFRYNKPSSSLYFSEDIADLHNNVVNTEKAVEMNTALVKHRDHSFFLTGDYNQELVTATDISALPDMQADRQINSGAVKVLLHFINNMLLSPAKLPVNVRLFSLDTIIRQPLWLENQVSAVWEKQLSIENVIVYLGNLLIVIIGVFWAARHWKFAGLVPLLVQTSYHIGNGFAMTSGERYLEPVIWVTFLYYNIGLFALAGLIFNKPWIKESNNSVETLDNGILESKHSKKPFIFSYGVIFTIVIIIGALLPITNIMPSRIENFTQDELISKTAAMLEEKIKLSPEVINTLLQNPRFILVEGIAYHARIYTSPKIKYENNVFELSVLGEDKVYISNFYQTGSVSYFSDESRVILVGCKINEKIFEGAETILLRTLAIIQLDHEKNVYALDQSRFACP